MFCSVCGKEFIDEAIICPVCNCIIKAKSNSKITKSINKKAQISFVLGIVGIVSAWLIPLVGHITSIVGIVFGIKEYKETEKAAGLILSIIGEICSIFSSVIGFFVLLNH